MELARKLAREMDAHRTVLGLARVRAQRVRRSGSRPRTANATRASKHEVIDELCAYLLEHARRENLILAGGVHVSFSTDERLSLGEFGIQAKLVRPDGQSEADPAAGRAAAAAHGEDEHGKTMIYSTSARVRGPVEEAQRAPRRSGRCSRSAGAGCCSRPAAATIGRSRDCDVVLEDSGISRRHAEIRPAAEGWDDRGPRLHQRRARQRRAGARARAAARRASVIEFGSTEAVFELG